MHHHVRFDVDLQYFIHLGSFWWKLVDLCWMPNDTHEARKGGVCNCTLIVTLSIQCGYLTGLYYEGIEYVTECHLLFCSFILLDGMGLSACPPSLSIHGNSCPMGSTTGKCIIFLYAVTYDHCKAHLAITVCLCTHEAVI